jgi:hypothetical protein
LDVVCLLSFYLEFHWSNTRSNSLINRSKKIDEAACISLADSIELALLNIMLDLETK